MNIWEKALTIMKAQLSVPSFETWFRPVTLQEEKEDEIVLKVPYRAVKDRLESKYFSFIQKTLSRILGKEVKISFVVKERKAEPQQNITINGVTLCRRYTFENFVVGGSNRLAYAAAIAVANSPGGTYNPLYIYGSYGPERTHLLQAIAHYLLEKHPELKIIYTTTEKFTNEVIYAIQNTHSESDLIDKFHKRYRSVDLLLMEDVQFLADRKRVQEEFFRIFNTLHDAGKQIVLTSNCPPKDIATLEERLTTRFEWGLVAYIQPPDFYTRVAILKKKSEIEGIQISDEVLFYIAKNVVSNIRGLEGALIRLIAKASLSNEKITLSFAKKVLEGIDSTSNEPFNSKNESKKEEEMYSPIVAKNTVRSVTPFLDEFGRDLTRLAREGKLLPCIGRKEEMRKVAQILVQKRKNNPILVGDAGVGKTCIVEGLAQRIIEPDASPTISDFRIVELNMGTLVASTIYRGMFEERMKRIIEEASSDPNIILFIDEFHTVMGAGAVGDGSLDASNMLKSALARGDIKCIGATTTDEYRKYIEKDSAFERRFQIVWVDEPTREEAVLILKGLKPNFEKHHGLKIPYAVIEKAVEFSIRYLTDFKLPDKAIDIIDQACARKVLKTISPVKLKEDTNVEEITLEDVARVVSERCRIPIETLTKEEGERLLEMEKYLSKRIFGQDHAVKEVAETIRSAKAGLKDPNKPIGVFLFLGETGTGKTELAKTLAEFLFYDESRLITLDMSEYQEKYSISKLIGAPPGYIGYDEEGQLTSNVRTNPYSVILFDEIEKACPEVFDLFLQIFDEGRLTDAHGRKVNFSEAVIILTSNIGSDLAAVQRRIGFETLKTEKAEIMTSKKKTGVSSEKERIEEPSEKWKSYFERILQGIDTTFRPEFLNRIQKKIVFYPLSKETVKLVINKIAKELNQLLSSKGIEIILSDSAIDFLMEKGYNEAYGAREMKRTFEQYISEPLSQMLLKGKVKSGQVLRVSSSGDAIQFKIT